MAVPTLKQLRYLVSLADLRNFSRAAEACFVTQSALSGAIQDLESLLGVSLFERTKRKVLPTPVGLQLAERARKILNDVDALVELARAQGDPFTQPVRLGVIPTIGPFLLPAMPQLLRQDFPDLKLVLREDQTARLLEQLTAGELDLLILAFPYPLPDGLEVETFMDDPFWVACPRGHPLSGTRPVEAARVPREELLLLEDGHCLRDHALAACRLEGEARSAAIQGTSLYTLLQMVANGLGITLVPAMAIGAPLLTGLEAEFLPMSPGTPTRRVGFVWRRSSARGPVFRRLADLLRVGAVNVPAGTASPGP